MALLKLSHEVINVVILLYMQTFISLSNAELTQQCTNTSCTCFEDFAEVEYQCPDSETKNKMVIHLEESNIIRVECWDVENIDLILPNMSLSGEEIILSDCPITYSVRSLFTESKIKKLKVENVQIYTYNGRNFFTQPLTDLTKLNIRSVTFDAGFDGIVAPNVTYLEFEGVEISIVKKLSSNFPKVLKLNLNGNEIDVLDHQILNNFPELKGLVLSRNNLKYLQNNIFNNLTTLESLQIDFNNLEYIDNKAFENLGNLLILDISNNNITKLDREILKPLKSLKNIYVDSNVGIELDDFLFSNFSELTATFLSYCGIKYLPENIFTGSEKLGFISLGYNEIETITANLFKNLFNLQILDLSNNKLKFTDVNIFEHLTKLQTLNLQNNEIDSLDSNIFKSLMTLEELNLDNNRISHIHNDAFTYNQNLKKLYMSNNNYSYKLEGNYFSPSPFSSCGNLQELILSNNLVEDIMDDLLVYSHHLNQIDLSGNKIKTVYFSSFLSIARKDVVLNLESNQITHIIFDNSSNTEREIKKSDSTILISKNPIHCDCTAEPFLDLLIRSSSTDFGFIFKDDELFCNEPQYLNKSKFSELSPMELICPLDTSTPISTCTSSKKCNCFWRPHDKTIIVDCGRKNLTTVPQIIFSVNLDYNQTEVHLEGNHLREGPISDDGYQNVTRLYLRNNELVDISWIPPRIEVFDVSYNNLTNLREDVLNHMNESSLQNLYLGNNPWRCDCEIHELFNFVRKNIEKVDKHRIKCLDTGKNLHELILSNICINKVVLILSFFLTLCAIVCLSFAGIALFFKYKQEIKVWLYSRNLCGAFVDEEDLDRNKIYDVFISYSHKDGDFVFEQLVPELEKGPNPYKLCLHERDWIPGKTIVSNIAYSVVNSRRTLIILTPNFLESVWSKMEFKSAHAEAMREGRNRIILVLKDDVSIDDLDDELKLYIETNTYIKWKDFWFWKKLKHALPHKKGNNVSLKYENGEVHALFP